MVPVDLAGLRRAAFSAMAILRSAEGIQSEYLGDGTGKGGKPINPRQPVLGSFLLCFEMLNICVQREGVFCQQPLIKVSFIRWACRSATEQYFCWKTLPRGPLKWKRCLLMPDPGSPGTGSLLAHGACPALGGRLGLIAEGAAFFLKSVVN